MTQSGRGVRDRRDRKRRHRKAERKGKRIKEEAKGTRIGRANWLGERPLE